MFVLLSCPMNTTPSFTPPKVLHIMTFFPMLILGATNLIPWMTFLSLPDYFHELYGSNKMEFFFPAVSTSALVCTAAVTLAIGSTFSFNVRIAYPTAVMMVIGLQVPLVDVLVSANVLSLDAAFSFTLLGVLLSAVTSSLAQNSLYALAGLLGDSGTAALQAGQGVMGLLSLGLRCVMKIGLPPVLAMYAFCIAGSLMLLSSLIAYYSLVSRPSVRPMIEAHERRRAARSVVNPSASEAMLPNEAGSRKAGGSSSSSTGAPTALALLRLTYLESACVFSTFFVALSIFPGWRAAGLEFARHFLDEALAR